MRFRDRPSPLRAALAAVALALGAAGSASAAEPFPSLATETTVGRIETVATFAGAMPTGVTVAANGRKFVCFPRWGDAVPFTVGELRNGNAVAYPNTAVNRPDGDPAHRFISVQSVVAQGNRLWILDTAAPNFGTPVPGGAKLVAVDLATNRIVRTIVFSPSVVLPTTYLNDVRFDFRAGAGGVAYVTDSSQRGQAAIIVVDLAAGTAIRRLDGAPQTQPDPGFVPIVEGETLLRRPPNGPPAPFATGADGIALSADGTLLYFCPLSSRRLFAVPTKSLRDPIVAESDLRAATQDLGEKGASDGLEADAQGRVYAGDYEHDSIRVRETSGAWRTIVHDPRVLWPDTLSVAADGYLYFTANQLHRQALFHRGADRRRKPYVLFRTRIAGTPVDSAR